MGINNYFSMVLLDEGDFCGDETADQPGGFTFHFFDGFRRQPASGVFPFYLSEYVVHVGVADRFDSCSLVSPGSSLPFY
ncbi:hypothetical protein [Serratia fonticola]|uniref:hypothetical protein n=1 Tax=Serratia fonticola TaxID=47917 RepID=UPI003AAFC69B